MIVRLMDRGTDESCTECSPRGHQHPVEPECVQEFDALNFDLGSTGWVTWFDNTDASYHAIKPDERVTHIEIVLKEE